MEGQPDAPIGPSGQKTSGDDGTFLTGVGKAKKDGEMSVLPNGENISSLYGQIHSSISNLDKKVGTVLRKHEADFLSMYRGHMFNVQKEMRILKEKASEEENKRKRDEELVKMEKERDWFRSEAVRLDKICKEYKKSAEKWKNKAQALEEDRKFLEDQVLAAKKLNMRAKEQLEKYKEMYGAMQEKEDSEQSFVLEQGKMQFGESLGIDTPMSHVKKVSYTQGVSPDILSPLNEPVRAASQMEVRYIETINQLKTQLDAERRSLRQLKSVKTNYYLEKGELEEFFLQCIEEVRKEILARRMKSAQLLSRTANKTLDRSSSARHFPKAAVPDTVEDIKMELFTEGDKRRVIELLISNEQVLLFLHSSLFAKKEQSSDTRLLETPSSRSLNPSSLAKPVIAPAKNHGLRSHVFSVPYFSKDKRGVIRPSTAPLKPKAA